jgi:hypothetical protein
MATAMPIISSRQGELRETTPFFLRADRVPYVRKLAAFAAAVAQTIPTNRDVLLDALSAAGITTVVVPFDGGNGQGRVERMIAYARGGDIAPLPVMDVTVQEVVFDNASTVPEQRSLRGTIEIMAYTLLEHAHGEWSAGVGGCGELVFDVVGRSVTLEYNQRVVTVRNHTTRF